MNMHFQTFSLQPPHAPLFRQCFGSGQAWPPIRFALLSAVLRTSLIPSSLISRIRPYRVCVATLVWVTVLRTIRSLPVALHPASRRRSYFQLLAFSSAREGLPPSYARSLSSALGRVPSRGAVTQQPTTSGWARAQEPCKNKFRNSLLHGP